MVVIGLDKNLLFKSVLAQCVYLAFNFGHKTVQFKTLKKLVLGLFTRMYTREGDISKKVHMHENMYVT